MRTTSPANLIFLDLLKYIMNLVTRLRSFLRLYVQKNSKTAKRTFVKLHTRKTQYNLSNTFPLSLLSKSALYLETCMCFNTPNWLREKSPDYFVYRGYWLLVTWEISSFINKVLHHWHRSSSGEIVTILLQHFVWYRPEKREFYWPDDESLLNRSNYIAKSCSPEAHTHTAWTQRHCPVTLSPKCTVS
jgi:hypothetical protein